MREIKFRAWDEINKEMVYQYIKNISDNLFNHDILRKYDIVMQFTGLKDKNGKEIYEGDIVNFKTSKQEKQEQFYETKKSVHFYNGSFGFQEWNTDNNGKLTKRLNYHPPHFTTKEFFYIDFDIEVIGNIYENKNLL